MITIYHNPRCSNSRGALERIRARGIEPEIVDYLTTPPDAQVLAGLIARMGIPARELMRSKEDTFIELDLANPRWTEAELVAFMVARPVLINRPIVVTPRGARLCRPPELVEEIL